MSVLPFHTNVSTGTHPRGGYSVVIAHGKPEKKEQKKSILPGNRFKKRHKVELVNPKTVKMDDFHGQVEHTKDIIHSPTNQAQGPLEAIRELREPPCLVPSLETHQSNSTNIHTMILSDRKKPCVF